MFLSEKPNNQSPAITHLTSSGMSTLNQVIFWEWLKHIFSVFNFITLRKIHLIIFYLTIITIAPPVNRGRYLVLAFKKFQQCRFHCSRDDVYFFYFANAEEDLYSSKFLF